MGDTLDTSAVTAGVTLSHTGSDTFTVTDGIDTAAVAGVENIVTGSGDDNITSGGAH